MHRLLFSGWPLLAPQEWNEGREGERERERERERLKKKKKRTEREGGREGEGLAEKKSFNARTFTWLADGERE